MLLYCPLYMFCNQWRDVVFSACECCEYLVAGCRVAQRNRNISQPAFVPDATNGTAFCFVEPGLFVPQEQFGQFCIIESVAWREVAIARGLCKFIPRSEQLTVVATVYSITNRFAKFFGNRVLVFDRQVGNAAASV